LQAAFPPLETQISALTTNLKALNNVAYFAINHTDSATRSWISAGAVIAGFVAGTLLPMVGKISTAMSIFGKATTGVAAAEGAAGAAGSGSILSRIMGFAKIGGIAATLATYSGGLNKNEDAEMAKIRAKQDQVSKRMASGMSWDQANSEISVPKTPAPSTIASPSAVPANPAAAPVDSNAKSTPANAPVGPGIEKSPVSIDINSTLTYQSNLLAQILEGTKSLVSVNKDILRYTRNQ
jgi:hypothetical protein